MESSLLNDGGGVMQQYSVTYKNESGNVCGFEIIAKSLDSCIKAFATVGCHGYSDSEQAEQSILKVYYSNGRECGWASKEVQNA